MNYKQRINDAFNQLSPREQIFINRFLGRISGKPAKMVEMSKEHGITSERVSQIIKKGLRRMHKYLESVGYSLPTENSPLDSRRRYNKLVKMVQEQNEKVERWPNINEIKRAIYFQHLDLACATSTNTRQLYHDIERAKRVIERVVKEYEDENYIIEE